MDMTDREILQQILARGRFGHREHLELAWSYLTRHDPAGVHLAVRDAIRHVAALHEAPDKYHETITRFWIHLVAIHRAGSQAQSFAEFLATNPRLLDGRLLRHHYSAELLGSEGARTGWSTPDLRPLPARV
jgi:hypothetical protein